MAGFNVVVSPPSLTLAPGETKAFTVAFTRTTAALNAYTGGQLRWSDGDTHRAHPDGCAAGRARGSAEVTGPALPSTTT